MNMKCLATFFFIILTALFSLCSKSNNPREIQKFHTGKIPVMHHLESDYAEILWDKPINANDIAKYEIFYKSCNVDHGWKLIDSVSVNKNNYIVGRNSLPLNDSIFEIAVRSVSKNKSFSNMVSSVSDSVGWYIFWK